MKKLFLPLRILFILSVILGGIASNAVAEPHPHQGVLTEYHNEPSSFLLSDKEQQRLALFKPVYKKEIINGKQRGVTIFLVKASITTIWATIHQFSNYPKWIKGLKSAKVYEVSNNSAYVHFTATHWLLGKTQWYVKHNFPRLDQLNEKRWGAWVLDYRHQSDFYDAVGFWQVKTIHDQPNVSEVIYSVDLQLKEGTPAFIQRAAIKKGLKSATKWLKRESELAQANL